ncbi:hypothetical protein RD110_14800 [Rhodoferax koreense]|uniref:Uncharacterized protein n=1 Tax=Rhodoferax koreensis TaxID=1842727 RepID=A0A1P8JX73_9BURK|nr:hypothetical protein RD110_14800 [Rhodoferax koreense]
MALACIGAGGLLAMHYPVVPVVAAVAFALAVAVFLRWPDLWLLAVPTLLPLVGFAPWTGWITFEELDLLVLAAAAGGYARAALPGAPLPARGQRVHLLSPGPLLLLLAFALSTLVAMERGFEDAGGFAFGWYQGYHEPMNSLRLAKSFFLAALVVPLWWGAVARRGEQAATWLATGLSLGLAAASLTTVWERLAFTGLFDFSSDYRTTGMFWEMHVGGAALDGFLTLCVPFAVREVFFARSTRRWAAAVACLALAGYACLTTFSRGVYLAVPIAVAVTLACCMLSARRQAASSARSAHSPPATTAGAPLPAAPVATSGGSGLLPGALLVASFTAAIWWVFPSSGYRGLLALLGALGLALPLARPMRGYKAVDWVMAVIGGAVLGAGAAAIASLVDKGAYFAYALSAAFCVCMLFLEHHSAAFGQRRGSAGLAAQLAFSGYLALLVSAVLVANHWGGPGALNAMLLVVLAFLLLVLWAGAAPKPPWPASYRWQATALAAMLMVGGTLGVMAGGAYMSERFSTSETDLDGRIDHWRRGWWMLSTPADQALGKGLGRFPASYFFAGVSEEHPGDYRLKSEPGNTYLTIGGGKQRYMGWGEMLRISQRIAPPTVPAKVSFMARAAQPVYLHLEVCQKHLLYNADCLLGSTTLDVKPDSKGQWQQVNVPLQGKELSASAWYAPRLTVFSIATGTAEGVVDIDRITLTDGQGRSLLDNGDFSQGLQRWFFSSDRNHMPWHIKSLLMNVLFDQGLVGLALFGLLGITALWRVVLGSAKDHALAPAIAGGLIGFVVVGLFDSLVDVPRLAFLFYLVLMLGLSVRPGKAPPLRR